MSVGLVVATRVGARALLGQERWVGGGRGGRGVFRVGGPSQTMTSRPADVAHLEQRCPGSELGVGLQNVGYRAASCSRGW